MGYGNGWWWHRFFDFPDLPLVTKTVTVEKQSGYPFAIMRLGSTVYNHIALHNKGIFEWVDSYYKHRKIDQKKLREKVTLSIYGTDHDIDYMMTVLHHEHVPLAGVELNYSCPNVSHQQGKRTLPKTDYPLWLKLRHNQDPYAFDLDRIQCIRVNSVPCWFGGMSGKGAQEKNWAFIKKFNQEGLNVAGCSFVTHDDLRYLEEYCGCTEVGIGATILVNPKLVESLA